MTGKSNIYFSIHSIWCMVSASVLLDSIYVVVRNTKAWCCPPRKPDVHVKHHTQR